MQWIYAKTDNLQNLTQGVWVRLFLESKVKLLHVFPHQHVADNFFILFFISFSILFLIHFWYHQKLFYKKLLLKARATSYMCNSKIIRSKFIRILDTFPSFSSKKRKKSKLLRNKFFNIKITEFSAQNALLKCTVEKYNREQGILCRKFRDFYIKEFMSSYIFC